MLSEASLFLGHFVCQELNSEITQLDTEAGLMGWSYDVLWVIRQS